MREPLTSHTPQSLAQHLCASRKANLEKLRMAHEPDTSTLALQKLTQALALYDSAAKLASFLKLKAAYDIEDERWITLAYRAYVCGYRMQNAKETALDWSRAMVARFANGLPLHHKAALAEIEQ